MLENPTTLNQNRTLQNLAIAVTSLIAIALFALTINSLGLFRFGSAAQPVISNNSLLVQTEDFKFAQQEINLTGETELQLALSNSDILPHSFDVDELDIHIAMPANSTAETTLTLTQPGTYTFYCAITGHREAGMVGTVVVE